jgi:hypothetical protein
MYLGKSIKKHVSRTVIFFNQTVYDIVWEDQFVESYTDSTWEILVPSIDASTRLNIRINGVR